MDKMDDYAMDYYAMDALVNLAMDNQAMDQSSKNITVGWTSHHDELVDGLWNSYLNNYGTDLDIQWGNRLIKVHRLLLDLFLSAENLIEAAASIDQPDSSLDMLLEFLYRGKVTFPEECLEKILDLAKKSNFQLCMDALEKASESSDHNSKSQTLITTEHPSHSGQTPAVRMVPIKKRNTDSKETTSQELPKIKCQECSFKSRSKEVMLKHQAGHNSIYKCTICPKLVSNERQLKRHLALHEASSLYNCKRCSYQTSNDYSYHLHVASHQSKSQITSHQNKKRILYDPILLVDTEIGTCNELGTNDKLLLCDICQHEFSDENELYQHREMHKGEWLQCTSCPYRTLCNDHEKFQVHVASHESVVAPIESQFSSQKASDQRTLDQHVSERIDQPDVKKIHPCPHCSYKTSDLDRHTAHVAAHLKKSDQEVKCQHCRNVYSDQSTLDSHKCQNAGRPMLSCPHCPYKTHLTYNFKIHIAHRHSPNVAIYKCGSCGRTFLKEAACKKHQLTCKMLGKKPFKCPQCDYTNKFRHQVGYHITAVHSVVKPYKCQVAGCDYATGHKTNLRLHTEGRHTDPNRFVCETCGFSTGRRCHLKHHLLTHADSPKYTCEICGRAYRHAQSLSEHMSSHTGIDNCKHICHICGSAFRRRNQMRVHLRGVHKTDVQPVFWNKKKTKTTIATTTGQQPDNLPSYSDHEPHPLITAPNCSQPVYQPQDVQPVFWNKKKTKTTNATTIGQQSDILPSYSDHEPHPLIAASNFSQPVYQPRPLDASFPSSKSAFDKPRAH